MKKFFCLFLAVIMLMLTSKHANTQIKARADWKITDDLMIVLDNLSDEDCVMIYAVLNDIDYDLEMAKFKDSYPLEYEEFCKADEIDTGYERRLLAEQNPDYEEEEYVDPINKELLQSAIEAKRTVFAEDYEDYNQAFIKDYYINEVIFVSCFSPMVIISVLKSEVYRISGDERVLSLDLYVNGGGRDELAFANKQSGAESLRDVYELKGDGIKIGMIESDGVPNVNHNDLANATIILHSNSDPISDHATTVARIIVGSQNGIVPRATLYVGVIGTDTYLFYDRVEWFLRNGVNIINMSACLNDSSGDYNFAARWVDHIAVQHNVHFVKSAGNYEYIFNYKITAPGMAYNEITVGNFYDNGSYSHSDDTLSSSSCYKESEGGNRPEKPNLVAAGTMIYLPGSTPAGDENYNHNGNNTGTSFSAPQVTGVIAQLCCYDTTLKMKQTTIGAILEASAARKVTGTSSALGAGIFQSDSINEQISDKEGAGKLSAEEARKIIHNGKYWKKTIQTESFPYTQNVYISSANNSHIRVAIFWLKRNSFSTDAPSHTQSPSNYLSAVSFSNLNLKVYAPDGTQVGSSTTTKSNYEIVQFDPDQTGYYRIVISKSGTNSSTKEFVGIAVW